MSIQKNVKWLVKASHEETEKSAQVKEISAALGLRPQTAQLLVNRGCNTPEEAKSFLEVGTERLHDPFLMKDMKKAAQRILDAAKNGEKTVIYGDYDVDGVTSVSILHMYLSSIGADVGYYIPSRLGEGYGMSEASVRRLADEGYKLVITVDTGITAAAEAHIIKDMGMELIVTDHHECHGDLPDAYAVVNPKQPDCPYPFKELAGVGVVFKLICAMEILRRPDASELDCVRCAAAAYCDLVAIGTVADVMPLKDENRLIVTHGLSMIEKSPRVSLAALLNACTPASGAAKRKITSGFIGFTIAPRVNAAGRIRSASTAVELFLCTNLEKAAHLAEELCEINRERQIEENKITEEAFAKINEEHDFAHDPVIVISDENWHHGIIGIVASRITEKYNRPSILISFDSMGEEQNGECLGKGSGRSVKGMNLVNALTCCSDLLVKYGGHELAAGLSIERDKLDEFRQRINDYARGCFDTEKPEVCAEAECELYPEDTDMKLAAELYRLEPFGVSNPVPVFVMYDMRVAHISSVGGGKHTKLTLSKNNLIITAMYFRRSPAELDLYENDRVDVMFNLDINEYQNTKSLQFIVKNIRLADKLRNYEESERGLYEKINSSEFDFSSVDPESARTIIPQREDFAALYNLLRRELRMEHDTFSLRALSSLLTASGASMRYVKIRYIIRVFQELNILGVDCIDEESEVYRFKYIYVKTKADLNKSNVLKKLRTSFLQKQGQI